MADIQPVNNVPDFAGNYQRGQAIADNAQGAAAIAGGNAIGGVGQAIGAAGILSNAPNNNNNNNNNSASNPTYYGGSAASQAQGILNGSYV